jgi:hypothetical protein
MPYWGLPASKSSKGSKRYRTLFQITPARRIGPYGVSVVFGPWVPAPCPLSDLGRCRATVSRSVFTRRMDVFNPVKTARFLWHKLPRKTVYPLYHSFGNKKSQVFKRGSYPRRKHGDGEGGLAKGEW